MIELIGLCKSFEEKVILKDFSLRIEDGEFVVITGKSGCGKTTLLNMIGGLEPADAGEILVDGIDILKRRNKMAYFQKKVGFLFQNFALVDTKTVRENMEMIYRRSRSEVDFTAALEQVGLADRIDTKVYKLSGGEQQRVALARLMVKKCDIILADEPTGALDEGNARLVLHILQELNRMGRTVVMVTHARELVRGIGRNVELECEK